MDEDIDTFAHTFSQFMETMIMRGQAGSNTLTPLGETVQDFLGVELASVDPVTENYPEHQVVDVDYAARKLVERNGGTVIGVTGAERMHIDSFQDFLMQSHWRYRVGPVSYTRVATGPTTDRRVIMIGISMLQLDGVPLVAMHRAANKRFGREEYALEMLCADPAVIDRYLALLTELMSEHSVLRGQVISFQPDHFEHHDPGSTLRFLERPDVTADQVILPDGVLERVSRHVVGIGARREALAAAGQHLKRGVLLYGPPGTGKTHIVRHLLSQTPETTAVLLSGRTLGLLNDATKLARANQPAIIVLEDCDLVAEERGGDTNAALFETLEALDGLDGDADIAFILTTNRPDLLERALVERPGRVDLAVQIGLPDADARRALLSLYAGDLALSAGALSEAAERTEGATASFAKELIRRCVLQAADVGAAPGDVHLLAALDEMSSESETLTRTLLGGGGYVVMDDEVEPDESPW